MRVPLGSFALVGFATACTPVVFTQPVAEEVEVEANLSGPCEGAFTQEGLTVSKALDDAEENCIIDIQWSGDVVDMGPVREEAASQVGSALDSVNAEITEIVAQVTDLSIVDAEGAPVPLVDATVDAAFDMAGTRAFTIEDAPIEAIVSEPIDVPIEPALVERVQAAFDEGAQVPGEGSFVVSVPVDELPALQSAGQPVSLTVAFEAEFTLQVGLDTGALGNLLSGN